MPNWGYMGVSLAWYLGLAIWIGGGIVLGAIVAPSLFRGMESRPAAGEMFGQILRKYARLRAASVLMIVAAAATRFVVWEGDAIAGNRGLWILIRWGAIAVMAAGVAWEILFLEKAIGETRSGSGDQARFDRLHRQAGIVFRLTILAAMVALFFS